MIDNRLLKTLVVFAEEGTLAKTAFRLHLTQPAITHSLKELEQELQIELFLRKPNKIYLNETGKFTARAAKKLLIANDDFVRQVKLFDQDERTITIAANAPGPLIVARALQDNHLQIRSHFIEKNFAQKLMTRQITCLLLNQPLCSRNLTSLYLGNEKMSVNLPQNDPLAHQQKLTFKMLAGKSILSTQQIGFWQKIYEKNVPHGQFIYQKENKVYSEILKYSAFPFFTTNLTKLDPYWNKSLPHNRITRPLTDAVAQQKFYACFLKRNQVRLQPFLQQMRQKWVPAD